LPSTETFWEAIRQSATAHVVLPDEESDLDRAATRFLVRINADQWTQLDQFLQDRVLSTLGGLHQACVGSGDMTRNVAAPLVDQAAECLGGHLPIMDVAEVQLATAPAGKDQIAGQTEACLEKAAPLVAGKETDNQTALLLYPASEAGKTFGESARLAIPDLKLVRVPGQADLMFCREQGFLTIEDLQRLLRPCRPAYETMAGVPQTSPHARCDIVDWVPLDP
jgi:hypothetical protein